MKLNKKVEIGMNVVGALQKRQGFVRTADLATEIGAPKSFLEQIMRDLRTGGIVDVKHGPTGGYALKKDTELTAYSVAKAVGRFPDDELPADSGLSGILKKNIEEAFKSTKL